jgi:aminoglycoside phosphotransferase (APT) family kinase protein
VESCRVLNYGVNSTAVVINRDYVFRFPARQGVLEEYWVEKKILDAVRPHIKSTSVPAIEICGDSDGAFAWHKVIDGIDYYHAVGRLEDRGFKRSLAQGLAKFCQEMHSIGTDAIDFVDTRQFSTGEFVFDDKSHLLGEVLGDEYPGDLEERLSYVDNYKNFDPDDDVLCHNDLHEENFIVNDAGLSGVIDFSCVTRMKRDSDFTHLLEYDPQLAFWTVEEYEKLTGKKIDMEYAYNVQKVRCYGLLIWFLEEKNEKYIDLFKKLIANLNRIEF